MTSERLRKCPYSRDANRLGLDLPHDRNHWGDTRSGRRQNLHSGQYPAARIDSLRMYITLFGRTAVVEQVSLAEVAETWSLGQGI